MNLIRKAILYIAHEIANGIERSTIGVIIIFLCLFYTGYLVFNEGGSDTVENLIMTAYVVGCALLGLNIVIGDKNAQSNDDAKKTDDKSEGIKEGDVLK